MLSSQSAFLATSSTSFLSWIPRDGDTCKCKTTDTDISFFRSPFVSAKPQSFGLLFSRDSAGYIWTTMNHCLFNETLMQRIRFLDCLCSSILTEQQHTWSGRRHHLGYRSRYRDQVARIRGSSLGSRCLERWQDSLELEVKCQRPSGRLVAHPAKGFCLLPWRHQWRKPCCSAWQWRRLRQCRCRWRYPEDSHWDPVHSALRNGSQLRTTSRRCGWSWRRCLTVCCCLTGWMNREHLPVTRWEICDQFLDRKTGHFSAAFPQRLFVFCHLP